MAEPTREELLEEARRRGIDIAAFTGEIVPPPPLIEEAGGLGFPAIGEAITGGERITPRVEAAEEIGALAGTGEDFRLAVGLLATSDPQAQISLIQNVLPEATIDTDEFGTTFVGINGQEFTLNEPGLSQQDILQATGQILSFIPAARLQSFLGRFAAGGGTSAALDIAAETAGAEIAPEEVGVRAGIAGAVEAVTPPALRALGRGVRAAGRGVEAGIGRVRGVPPPPPPPPVAIAAPAAIEAEAVTGIQLFPAQRAGVPRELLRQSFVAELPGGSQRAAKALEQQNKESFDAVQDFFDVTAPAAAVETGERRVRLAAQKSIEAARAARSEKASPLFEEAFGTGTRINTRGLPIPLEQFPKGGEIHRSLTRVQSLLGTPGTI